MFTLQSYGFLWYVIISFVDKMSNGDDYKLWNISEKEYNYEKMEERSQTAEYTYIKGFNAPSK